jgi:ABC-2 type transport system permease protein
MKLYRIKGLMLKYWYISTQSWDRIADVTYWPIIGMLMFGFTTVFINKSSDIPNIFLIIVGGIILWTLFQRIQQDVSVYIMEDFWSRNVANMFVTPVQESELFAAVSLFGILRALISLLIMSLLAIFAYQFDLYQGGFLPMLFIPPLFIFAWGMGIFVAGIIYRVGIHIQVLAWSTPFLLQPIATMTYPLEVLPVWLQKIALVFPLHYVFEGFRQAYVGNFSWTYIAFAYGISVVYLVLGYYVFATSVKHAKKTGLITQY